MQAAGGVACVLAGLGGVGCTNAAPAEGATSLADGTNVPATTEEATPSGETVEVVGSSATSASTGGLAIAPGVSPASAAGGAPVTPPSVDEQGTTQEPVVETTGGEETTGPVADPVDLPPEDAPPDDSTPPVQQDLWEALEGSSADWLWGVGAEDVAAYPDGDVVVGGSQPDVSGAAVARYTTTGERLWLYRYDGRDTNSDSTVSIGQATSVAIDAQGNVFATMTGGANAAVVKLSPDGVEQWTRPWAETWIPRDYPLDSLTGIAVTANGDIIVSARYGFITKYSASGDVVWTSDVGVDREIEAWGGIAVDEEGRSYVAGDYDGAWLAALDVEGRVRWTRTVEDSYGLSGVVVPANGNPTAVAFGSGDLDGDGEGRDASTLMQYSPDGELLFASALDVEGIEHPYDIALTPEGGIVTVSGLSLPEITWDAYVAEYSASGELQGGARLFGGGFIDHFQVAAGAGKVFVSGFTPQKDFLARL